MMTSRPRARPLPDTNCFAKKSDIRLVCTIHAGEAIVRALAAEGVRGITIADRNEGLAREVAASIQGEFACSVHVVAADLSVASECERTIQEHDATFGRVDGLINCAASTARGTWDETSANFFDEMMAINCRAPFLLMQGAGHLMEREGHGGAVVNIGSVHAHGGMPKLCAYAASKGALLTLTRNFAFAKRRARIRANYIALGWTATPAEHRTMVEYEGMGEGWLERVADPSHPMGRIFRPWEVARLVVHLVSDEAQLHTATCIDLHEKFFGTWE